MTSFKSSGRCDGLRSLGCHQTLDLEMELARCLIERRHSGPFRIITARPIVEAILGPLSGVFGVNSKRGANTCSISRLAAMALSVSLMASTTTASAASGSAIRLVNRARPCRARRGWRGR